MKIKPYKKTGKDTQWDITCLDHWAAEATGLFCILARDKNLHYSFEKLMDWLNHFLDRGL